MNTKQTTEEQQPVRFIHLRMHDDGEIQTHGGATIAYVRDRQHVAYAIAKCNEKDVFNRKLGRIIAENRLNRGVAEYLEVDKEAIRGQIIAALCNEYYDKVEQYYPDPHMYLYPKCRVPKGS